MTKTKGFTLLEMVLVMSVIAVLFLLTIPNLQNVLSSVSSKGCDAQTKVVDTAIVQYRLDHDVQSVSLDQLVDNNYLTNEQLVCQNGQPITIVDGHATY